MKEDIYYRAGNPVDARTSLGVLRALREVFKPGWEREVERYAGERLGEWTPRPLKCPKTRGNKV